MDREEDLLDEVLDIGPRHEGEPAAEGPAEDRRDLAEEQAIGLAVAGLCFPHQPGEPVVAAVRFIHWQERSSRRRRLA